MSGTKQSATHNTFVIERTYPAAPSRVYKAFADAAAKSQWFSAPEDWESGRYELDFRNRRSRAGVGRTAGRPGAHL